MIPGKIVLKYFLNFSSIFLFATVISCNQIIHLDYALVNGKVFNGKSFKEEVTVGIRGDSIIMLDSNENFRAEKTIDVNGKIISPGFIDLHSHGDPLTHPQFLNFISQGVTTICLGQDGFSPYLSDFQDWINTVNDTTPSVNIIPFAGHNTLRLMTKQPYDSLLNASTIEEMNIRLQEAFDFGVFGLSTGLEYNPGYYSGKEELTSLAKTVGKNNALIMSHMRNEDDDQIEKSIRELLNQGNYCRVHISHFKSVYGRGAQRAIDLLRIIYDAQKNGTEITADLYPYEASYTGFGILFTEWAKPPNNYSSVLKSRKPELKQHLKNRIEQRNGPEAMVIGSGEYAGMNLLEVSEKTGRDYIEILLEKGPEGGSAAYFVMNKELQETLIKSKLVGIASDGSPTMYHPRGYATFSKVIEDYVVKDDILSLEEALFKMTGFAASVLGIEDRGILINGNKADLVVFDPQNVKQNADFINPHKLSEGIDLVFVNGILSWKNQALQNRNGKVLLKSVNP